MHYGKALSYLHCRIENIINTGSAYCDCEKQIKDNNDNNQAGAAQKTGLKEKATENIFTLNKQIKWQDNITKSIPAVLPDNIPQLLTGFHTSIFQPPKV